MSEHNKIADKIVISKTVAETLKVIRGEKKYATSETEDYNIVRRSFADLYEFDRVSDLTWRVNSLADLWKKEHGGLWPSISDMTQWDIAHNSIGTFAAGYSGLAASFTITQPDGTWIRYNNDPVRGPIASATQDTPDFEFIKTGVRSQHIDVIPQSDLAVILTGLSPIRQPTGGGGGGRAAREPMAFDRRELAEAAIDRWRGLLLEEPDDAVLDGLVSGYITDANAFWVNEAGRLDYDTYVTDRIRATERHGILYGKKPEFQSEAEYMGGFRQTVGQFGLGGRAALREIEAGATSGAGLAGFGERVGRTREARFAAGGGFSRQLANQMSQMGSLG